MVERLKEAAAWHGLRSNAEIHMLLLHWAKEHVPAGDGHMAAHVTSSNLALQYSSPKSRLQGCPVRQCPFMGPERYHQELNLSRCGL